jgi:hypothetical protein
MYTTTKTTINGAVSSSSSSGTQYRRTRGSTVVPRASSSSSSNENENSDGEVISIKFGIGRGSRATYDDANGGPTTYVDGPLDVLAISLFNAKLAAVVNAKDSDEDGLDSKTATGFDRLVALADRVGDGRSVDEQRTAVTDALLSIIPAPVRYLFKKLIKPSNWVDEMNAVVTREAFAWLVGPCEITPRESDGVMASVRLRKCRYLEQCGCTASCTNFCKIPTQRFFKEAFGVDATLAPNHEDGSCVMTFGVAPDANDPAFSAPCYATCKKASAASCESGQPCHRLGEQPRGY